MLREYRFNHLRRQKRNNQSIDCLSRLPKPLIQRNWIPGNLIVYKSSGNVKEECSNVDN